MRTAEVVGALSIATDLGTGQPLEHALRSAVLAVRLGELAGASAQELADTYYVALLHASGCTSNGHEATLVFGEDIEHRAAFYLVDTTSPAEVLAFYKAYVGAGHSPEVRERMLEAALADPVRAREALATMCEVAQRFADWLDLGPEIHDALEYVFARWDGRGLPGTAGDAIPLPMRLLHVARDISLGAEKPPLRRLSRDDPDQGRHDRRPNGSPVLHGDRERQRRPDGDRRDQRRRRAPGPPDRAVPRGRRDHRQRRGGVRGQARHARRRRRDLRR